MHNRRTWVKSGWIWILLVAMVMISCAPEVYLAKNQLRKDPRHKANIPEKPACPIDGLWKDAYYGYKSGIEKGRLFTADTIMVQGHDMSWPMVSVKEIVRVAPGKYRCLADSVKKWRPATISVVSKNELVLKREGKVHGIYHKIRLNNEKWFLSDFNQMTRKATTSAPAGRPSVLLAPTPSVAVQQESRVNSRSAPAKAAVEIHSLTLTPATIAPGAKFDLRLAYQVADHHRANPRLPAWFSYSIWEGETVLMKSKPVVIQNENGHKMERVVHLSGSKKKGVYSVRALLKYDGLSTAKAAELIICDNPVPLQAAATRPSSRPTPSPMVGILPDPGTLVPYRSKFGTTLLFRVTGKRSGSVYGTSVYTDDSRLAAAAVHAGALVPGQTGVVKVTILPGQPRYPSSYRNGVKSRAWGAWTGSYRVEAAGGR